MSTKKFRKATKFNVPSVLRRFSEFAREQDGAQRHVIAKAVNAMLDDLLQDDFFGTEGQCDPRGDHRP